MSSSRLLGLIVCAALSVACDKPIPCGYGTQPSKESVTKAPGTYEGYEVSAVGEDRTVQVIGKGSKKFAGSRTQCRSLSSWGYAEDGGVPTYTDQDDRCNFEAKLYWHLVTSGVQLGDECEFGFETGVRIDDWANMDRAIEIVGAELRAADLGETYVVGRKKFVCL